MCARSVSSDVVGLSIDSSELASSLSFIWEMMPFGGVIGEVSVMCVS